MEIPTGLERRVCCEFLMGCSFESGRKTRKSGTSCFYAVAASLHLESFCLFWLLTFSR